RISVSWRLRKAGPTPREGSGSKMKRRSLQKSFSKGVFCDVMACPFGRFFPFLEFMLHFNFCVVKGNHALTNFTPFLSARRCVVFGRGLHPWQSILESFPGSSGALQGGQIPGLRPVFGCLPSP